MSNAVELQFISSSQSHNINTQIQKQQPTNKLVTKYLSTAAHYLNRTKSFHLSKTNDDNKNDIQAYTSGETALSNNPTQSMPTNIHNISSLTELKMHPNHLPISVDETNSSGLPLNGNNNHSLINGNKSRGLVNIVRRSLRKNKERFHSKRSTTMKSCYSLNADEQITNDYQDICAKISMTPTLFCRRQHITNNIDTYSIGNITTYDDNYDQTRKK